MKYSNGTCTQLKGSLIPFNCNYYDAKNYCSQNCKLEDWNAVHSEVCRKSRLEKLKKTEETCPFIKLGQFLDDTEADIRSPKHDNVYTIYEPVRNTKIIGKGSYGEVILMRDKTNKKLVAMKIINKNGIIDNKVMNALNNEINVQKKIIHENIVGLITHIEDTKNIYIVMEYADKGSLFQLLRRKSRFSEKEAFYFFTQTR